MRAVFCIDIPLPKFRISYKISSSAYRPVPSRNACIIYGLDPGPVDALQSATDLPKKGTFMSISNVLLQVQDAWIFYASRRHFLGDYLVGQAQTQGLSVMQQLNNGMRFLDIRLMLTQGGVLNTMDWRGLHMMQTQDTAEAYFGNEKNPVNFMNWYGFRDPPLGLFQMRPLLWITCWNCLHI